MKKSVFIIMLLLTISVVHAAALTGTIPGNADLKITKVNQDPDPAEPGSFTDLRVQVENLGAKTAENVTLQLKTSHPLYVYDAGTVDEKKVNIGAVGAFQEGDDRVIKKFKLKVDKSALEGDHEIFLSYRSSNDASWVTLSALNVSVKPHDAFLSVDVVEVQPSTVTPGQLVTLRLSLVNLANAVIKDVRTVLDLDASTVPFAPVNGVNEKLVNFLEPDSMTTIAFTLMAEPDAIDDLYKVPLDISYSDVRGKNYTKSLLTGVVVASTPDLLPTIESTELSSENNEGTISVKIVNKGTSTVKFVETRLGKSSAYTLLSPSSQYAGNIDSDDYETVDYTLRLTGSDENIEIPLTLIYRDYNNNVYEERPELVLNVRHVKNGSGFSTIFWLILLAALGYGFYIWKKKKKKRK